MSRVGYIGLGSNLGGRAAKLREGVEGLARAGIAVEAVSGVYETEPVGEVGEQPDFLNAAARIRTALEPEDLLGVCQAVELEAGRLIGGPRHGPRALDVDILLLGDLRLAGGRLTIPHPELMHRRFVLAPLLELDPELALPDGTPLREALAAISDEQRVERVGELA